MNSNKSVYAHTAPGIDYPAYINISRSEPRGYTVTVRSAGNGGRDGASIALTPEQLQQLATDAMADLHGGAPVVTDAMVSRFLSWRLPADFAPDCGITFKRESDYDHPEFGRTKYEPTGTNLLHAGQARAMLEHVLNVAVPMMRDGSPADPEKFGVVVVHTNAPATPPIPAYQQRVIDEKRELDDKLGKLDQFINGSALFDGLPTDEQDDLVAQHGHMAQYSRYLASRIARFGGAA